MDRAFWKDRTVLITGCTGFLGSWLTLRLIDVGASVIGLVRDRVPVSNFFRSGLHNRITVVYGSVTDQQTLERTINEYGVDTCFHLAAQAIVGTANRSPLSTFETNIAGAWTVLEAVRRSSTVKRMVVASSDKAYGSYPESSLPYTEDYALRGEFPYDVSKSCCDLIAQCYAKTYFGNAESGAGTRLGITRCGNLIGGGDLNFGRIVPDTIWALIHDKSPEIRSHGKHVRDFLYVLDAVGSYLLLAERLDHEDLHGEAFNFGLECPLTVLELVEKIVDLSGKSGVKPCLMGDAPAPGEILAQHLSSLKARSRLDWEPVYSLDQALADALEWYRFWDKLADRSGEDLYVFNLQLLRRFEDQAARQPG
ncbi:MAG: GDP-mannose 4,6-dehydratase [Armatimonadetes bacterium]|nr:GDP-mannose 4,6-dehydratase [Armatimonadota bacterium]